MFYEYCAEFIIYTLQRHDIEIFFLLFFYIQKYISLTVSPYCTNHMLETHFKHNELS